MGRTRTVNGVAYPVSDAHPAAEILPWMSDDELVSLRDDIAEKGQLHDIDRLAGTELLIDGRNRELACVMAGITPRYREREMTEEEIDAYVFSANVPRRHLDTSQRAMAAARLVRRGRGRPAKSGTGAGLTQVAASKLLDVSERSVRSAVAVDDVDTGLGDKVMEGKIDVKTAAQVAKLPKKERAKVAKAADPKKKAKEVLAAEAAAQVHEEVTGDRDKTNQLIKDGLGVYVPRGLADTFGDPMLTDCIARIKAAHRELASIEKHILSTLSKKGEFWPYALYGEAAQSLAESADRAAEAFAQLEAGVPFCVCPKCKGEGCADCRNSGAWPKHRYENRAQYGDAK
jgi:hypothetical protein